MKLKGRIAASATALLLIGSVMNVSAAELSSSDYVNTLIESNQESLIIDVNAYKAAYADLAKAFGNDTSAYVNHYLTAGVYEGRTKGVLFDPLIYANAYSDVKESLGYDIAAIVDHYLTHGIAEKRTQGTSHGYADIDAAEKAGVQSTNINRDVKDMSGGTSATANASSAISNGKTAIGSNISSNDNTSGSNIAAVGNSVSNNNAAAGSNTVNSAVPNNGSAGSSTVNNAVPNNSATGSSTVNNAVPNNSAASSNASNIASAGSPVQPVKDYERTTSIYTNDEQTLLRVEYYDANEKLIKYSQVSDYDHDTKSYTENIYHYDNETNTQVLERTDTYVNGSLVSSESK